MWYGVFKDAQGWYVRFDDGSTQRYPDIADARAAYCPA